MTPPSPSPEHPHLSKRAWSGLTLLLAFLLVNAGLADRNVRKLHDHAREVRRSEEVLDALDDGLSTMKDAETGQRGYLISGEEQYLRPYDDARAVMGRKLDRIAALTARDPRQRPLAGELRRLAAGKMDELARTIALRRAYGFEEAQNEVMTHLGKSQMDEIRAVVAKMRSEEYARLRSREAANDRAYTTAVSTGFLGAAAGIAALVGVVWALRRDAAHRALAAAALHEQKESLRTTLASIGDAVIATDTRGLVTFLNASASALTGWPAEEAAGKKLPEVFRIVNQETREIPENPVEKALRLGEVVGLANHTLLISRDGREIPIDDSAAPIRSLDGSLFGVVLVFRDFTEHKKAEDALHEADRRKNDFLATLAHELRNPLAPIRTSVELLRLAPEDRSIIERARSTMERQIRQMVRLIDDLLDVSRITRGKVQLRKEATILAEVVENAVEASRPLLDARSHRLSVILPDEPIEIDADPTRLAQVVSNLLNNAANYTEPGGEIRLSVERRGEEVALSVHDDGVGIAPENLPFIFDAFSQMGPRSESSPGGLGLGLSLAKGLVELHGGSIEARSAGTGRGTEFIVRLPVGRSFASSDTAPASPRVNPRRIRRRILVADDNRDAAASLGLLLELMGQEVRTAGDGQEAVKLCSEFQPEIAILDVGMPAMDGYEAARQIRRQRDAKITLVALTGWGQEEDVRKALAAGFDLHLIKPVSPETLEMLVNRPPGTESD